MLVHVGRVRFNRNTGKAILYQLFYHVVAPAKPGSSAATHTDNTVASEDNGDLLSLIINYREDSVLRTIWNEWVILRKNGAYAVLMPDSMPPPDGIVKVSWTRFATIDKPALIRNLCAIGVSPRYAELVSKFPVTFDNLVKALFHRYVHTHTKHAHTHTH
jgi:hypothetical protein